MGYCTQCGTENPPGTKFCTKCGKDLPAGVEQQAGSVPEGETKEHPKHGVAAGCILGAVAIYGAGAILVALMGFAVGAITGGALAAVLYFLAFLKVKARDYEVARKGCLGVAMAAVICVFINLGLKDGGGVLFNAVAASLLIYAYSILGKS